MFGERKIGVVLRAPFERGHYRTLVRFPRVFPRFLEVLARYLRGTGEYPWSCAIRTPTGSALARMFGRHDVLTVTEVFARETYRADDDLMVAVDIGANIGISAMYFLTRNHNCRVHLYEPVPRNVRRLRENLAPFEGRYSLQETAVADRSGTAAFSVEPTGRYGGIGVVGTEQISCRVVHINEVLAEVLACEDVIDVLKIDIEGLEEQVVRAIDSEHLTRIRTIYYETTGPVPMSFENFEHSYELQTNRLVNRGLAGRASATVGRLFEREDGSPSGRPRPTDVDPA